MRKGYFITSEESKDYFVGIRFCDGKPEVVFPHGYRLSNDEKECRKDVFRLLAVLKRFSSLRDGDSALIKKGTISSLPLSSYQYIIQDYLVHGYYSEKEVRHIESLKGKINWKRTIQQEQPQLDNSNIVYLQFQVKKNQINDDNYIARIHKYCVYQSFYRFGWLYLSTAYLPPKPLYHIDVKHGTSALKKILGQTFDDNKRRLFQSMINILQDTDEDVDINNLSLGVNKFETIWERLIDYVFGEDNKEKYFPHATWYIIKNDHIEQSSALEPDTIMKYQGKFYVLDAKYYQYGITGHPNDLPQTSSIQKQITYGKHIAGMEEIDPNSVYNAFIMPFSSSNEAESIKFVSVGTADWESYTQETLNYAYVLGLLLDTKHLISNYTRKDASEIEHMANLIETSLKDFKSRMKI